MRTINDFAGTRIPLNEKGSVVNMCKACRDQFDSITRNLIKCQKVFGEKGRGIAD